MNRTLGENIRFYRKKNKITQRELAKAICVSADGLVSKYESDSNIPSANVLAAIAKTCSVSMDELFYGEKVSVQFNDISYLKLLKEAGKFPEDEKRIVREFLVKISFFLKWNKIAPTLLNEHRTWKM